MSTNKDACKQIRRELEDHVGQVLTAISIKSKALELRLEPSHPQEVQISKEIGELANGLIITNRSIVERLSSSNLDCNLLEE